MGRFDELKQVIAETWPEYSVGDRIGKGASGAVFECKRNHTQTDFETKTAVKVIAIPYLDDKEEIMEESGQTPKEYYRSLKDDAITEIQTMDTLKSGHVVHINSYEVVERPNEEGYYILISMDLLTSLQKLVKEHEKYKLEENEVKVRKVAMDICQALLVCEKHDIVHRDIKPENIFKSSNDEYLLGDFGISKKISVSSTMSAVGTEEYVAPEMRTGIYDNRVDIYSLGLVLYKLANHGRSVFMPAYPKKMTAQDKTYAYSQRLSGAPIDYPDNCSEELASIILKMCAYRPEDRYQSVIEVIHALRGEIVKLPEAQPEKKIKKAKPKRKRKNKIITRIKIYGSLLLACLVLFAGFWVKGKVDDFLNRNGKPVKLTSNCLNITPNKEMIEGNGTISLAWNAEAFWKDVKTAYDKKLKKESPEEKNEVLSNQPQVEEWLEKHIRISVYNKTKEEPYTVEPAYMEDINDGSAALQENFNSGDEIEITLELENTKGHIGSDINVHFSMENDVFSYQLEDNSFCARQSLNPFDEAYFEVVPHGYDGAGTIETVYNGPDGILENDSFTVEKSDHEQGQLENGDKVTFSINNDALARLEAAGWDVLVTGDTYVCNGFIRYYSNYTETKADYPDLADSMVTSCAQLGKEITKRDLAYIGSIAEQYEYRTEDPIRLERIYKYYPDVVSGDIINEISLVYSVGLTLKATEVEAENDAEVDAEPLPERILLYHIVRFANVRVVDEEIAYDNEWFNNAEQEAKENWWHSMEEVDSELRDGRAYNEVSYEDVSME